MLVPHKKGANNKKVNLVSVILYKKTETEIESIMCNPNELQMYRQAGWFLDNGGEHDGMFEKEEYDKKQDNEKEQQEEEQQQQEFEEKEPILNIIDKMNNSEVREAAKLANIPDWEKARIQRLKEMLKCQDDSKET